MNATGARTSSADATRAATVIWAALNGAFLLMDDVKIFRDITGLEASRLLEETFEFQLAAAEAAAATRPRRSKAGAIKFVSAARARPAQRQEPARRSFRGSARRSGGAHDAGASERLAIG